MLINTLPLLEARASSEVAKVVSTADKMFRHVQADSGADRATRAALRYRRALLEGVVALKTRPPTAQSNELGESSRDTQWAIYGQGYVD